MRRVLLMVLVVVAACTKRNPALPDAGLNARCEGASDCAAPYGVCVAGRCGDCETSDSCPAGKPICLALVRSNGLVYVDLYRLAVAIFHGHELRDAHIGEGARRVDRR
jgi:hypothetical protein